MNLELVRAIIFVKDMPSIAAFYQDVLGLTEVVTDDTSDGWRVLSAGGMQLALHAIPAQIAEGIAISAPPEARSLCSLANHPRRYLGHPDRNRCPRTPVRTRPRLCLAQMLTQAYAVPWS